MQYQNDRRLAAIAAGCMLAASLAAPAGAQDNVRRIDPGALRNVGWFDRPVSGLDRADLVRPGNEAAITRSLGQVQLGAQDLKLNQRQEVPFKAFDQKDPATGNPIAANTMLTLPNGKQVSAGQYYSELNRLEQGFNAMGYSLRTAPEKTRLMESKLDVSRLQLQARELPAQHAKTLRIDPGRLSLPTPEPDRRQQLIDSSRIAGIIGTLALPRELHESKSWGYTVGDPSVFSAGINTKLQVDGTAEMTKFSAEGKAGGSVFNRSADLLRVTAAMTAPKTGTMNGQLAVYVLGSNVYNQNKTGPALWLADNLEKSVDFNTTVHFALGPIPMSAKIGAHGDAGLKYSVLAVPVRASGSVGPYAHAKVYVQAGVDIVVAGAGAGANLTLVDYDGSLTGGLRIDLDSSGKPYFQENLTYCHELDALSGNVYVYAYVYVPRWGIPPWEKKQWDWTVWDWSGIHADGCLFDINRKIYL